MSGQTLIKRGLGIVAAAALLAAGAGAFWLLSRTGDQTAGPPTAEAAAPAGPSVEVVGLSPVASAPVISQTGFVEADRAIDLAFEVPGRVATVDPSFDVGTMINAGTVIARLETRRTETNIASARAELDRAESQLMEADAALGRARVLEDRNVTSAASLDDVRARRASAQASVEVARANLTTAREGLDDAELTAPFDAVVAAADLAPGQVVQPGSPVGRLIDGTTAEVRLSLTQTQIAALSGLAGIMGRAAVLRDPAMHERVLRDARVTAVVPEVTDGARLTTVVVSFEDPFRGSAPLQIGALVQVDIPVANPDDLVRLPVRAVVRSDAVWTVTPDDTLEMAGVEVVLLTEDRAYLRRGSLPDDARVVATDLAAARDGMSVDVVAATGSGDGAAEVAAEVAGGGAGGDGGSP
jgi:RND family efflux transporter MFP subunit